jgi:hypothetical protein
MNNSRLYKLQHDPNWLIKNLRANHILTSRNYKLAGQRAKLYINIKEIFIQEANFCD